MSQRCKKDISTSAGSILYITAKLANRPEYSIRFANTNVWNETTGYKSLLRSVIVEPNPEENNYSGDRFFQPRNQNSK